MRRTSKRALKRAEERLLSHSGGWSAVGGPQIKYSRATYYRLRKKLLGRELPDNRGGAREGSGRKKNASDKLTRVQRDAERKKRNRSDRKLADKNWRSFVFSPRTEPIQGITPEDIKTLHKAATLLFDKDSQAKSKAYSTTTVDTGGINDMIDGATTGQRRRLLYPTRQQLLTEHLGGQVGGHNKVSKGRRIFADMKYAGEAFFDHHFEPGQILRLLERITGLIATRLNNRLPEVTLIEWEIMMTPAGAPPQAAHADTHQNIVTVFVALNPTGSKGRRSGYFAAPPLPVPEKTPRPMSELKYNQLDLDNYQLDLDNSVQTTVVINHAAWPHYGPGNPTTEVRYNLFMAFAIDEMAARHTTGEQVYREI